MGVDSDRPLAILTPVGFRLGGICLASVPRLGCVWGRVIGKVARRLWHCPAHLLVGRVGEREVLG